jgi:hypothetical protein
MQDSLTSRDLAGTAAIHKAELLTRMFGVPALSAAAGAERSVEAPSVPPGHNIVGVGFGAKTAGGSMLDSELAVLVYVRTKLPMRSLSAEERVPAQIGEFPTDVVAVGDIFAQARPATCGVSIGHFAVTAGTLGCVVRKPGSETSYILSNNHVLANSNAASRGDDILEPGPMDGGLRANPIARLEDFEKLQFGGPANAMDAAIAEIINAGDVMPDILKIGRVALPPMPASLYQSVRKSGRTTLHTLGVIVDVSAGIRVHYGNQHAWFDGQLAILGAGGAFSATGDSGSLVVDGVTRRPVGLLFGGGISRAFATPIDPVLARFGVEIL